MERWKNGGQITVHWGVEEKRHERWQRNLDTFRESQGKPPKFTRKKKDENPRDADATGAK